MDKDEAKLLKVGDMVEFSLIPKENKIGEIVNICNHYNFTIKVKKKEITMYYLLFHFITKNLPPKINTINIKLNRFDLLIIE